MPEQTERGQTPIGLASIYVFAQVRVESLALAVCTGLAGFPNTRLFRHREPLLGVLAYWRDWVTTVGKGSGPANWMG